MRSIIYYVLVSQNVLAQPRRQPCSFSTYTVGYNDPDCYSSADCSENSEGDTPTLYGTVLMNLAQLLLSLKNGWPLKYDSRN